MTKQEKIQNKQDLIDTIKRHFYRMEVNAINEKHIENILELSIEHFKKLYQCDMLEKTENIIYHIGATDGFGVVENAISDYLIELLK